MMFGGIYNECEHTIGAESIILGLARRKRHTKNTNCRRHVCRTALYMLAVIHDRLHLDMNLTMPCNPLNTSKAISFRINGLTISVAAQKPLPKIKIKRLP